MNNIDVNLVLFLATPPHISPNDLANVGDRNPVTNLKRKQERADVTRKRRGTHAYSVNDKKSAYVLRFDAFSWAKTINFLTGIFAYLCQLLRLHLQATQGVETLATAIVRARLQVLTIAIPVAIAAKYTRLAAEARLMDVPQEDDDRPAYRNARRFDRFDEFQDDSHAEQMVNFTPDEMNYVLRLLGLGHSEYYYFSRPGNTRPIRFHREELFIFLMRKIKTGDENAKISDDFGCDPTRWTYGFKGFVRWLDDTWGHRTTIEGAFADYVGMLPYFADAIRRYIERPRPYRDPVTNQVSYRASVQYAPGEFGIASFLDATKYKIPTPGSGPNDRDEGASRKPDWYLRQRCVFDGHDSDHNLRTMTVLFPINVNLCHGPVSGRGDDGSYTTAIGLDDHLADAQRARGIQEHELYSTFGDLAFRGMHRAIRTRHMLLRSDTQRMENSAMNAAREYIELDYGDRKQKWKILVADGPDFKLEVDAEHSARLIRVAHLMHNIYACLRGSKSNTARGFDVSNITVEQFLGLEPMPM